MLILGVPYADDYPERANMDLMKQADSIAADLKVNGIEVSSDREIIAMIAYLHKLGRDLIPMTKNTPEKEIDTPALLSDQPSLEAGKLIFTNNCAACHGALGQGNAIGPNLIDNFWLHGSKDSEIYKSIHNGIPAKGMQAWKDLLTPAQLQQVYSFTVSIIGTTAPDSRAPQGSESIRTKTE
jgi:mono/diheme cytochrome c family protein